MMMFEFVVGLLFIFIITPPTIIILLIIILKYKYDDRLTMNYCFDDDTRHHKSGREG